VSEPVDLCTGIQARTTSRGHRVLTLDFTADPTKRDPAYAARMRALLGDKEFRREMLRDWQSSAGQAVYPEYTDLGEERFVLRAPGLLTGQPVYRGIDLGYRAPVCVWFQYSSKQDRVWVLREFFPRHLHVAAFRDAVLYLSGEIALETVDSAALEWIDAYRNASDMPKPPWFAPGTLFETLSGPEALHTESIAARDPAEATAARVLAARGLVLSIHAGPVKARMDVLRRMLTLRPDGHPGLLVDPACVGVRGMLNGGLVYPPDRGQRIGSELPRKDGTNDNLHDALTYGLVGVVPAVGPLDTPSGWTVCGQQAVADHFIRRERAESMETVGFYETRRRR